MQKKRASAVLTLILAILMLTFVALGHIVSTVYLVDGAAVGVAGLLNIFNDVLLSLFVPNFGEFMSVSGFVATVIVLGVALVLAIVWIVKLIYYRRGWNIISPFLFLIAIFLGVLLVGSHPFIEDAFKQPTAQVATAYFFVVGVIIVALALHLVVVGLKTAGTKKVASILDEDLDDEYVVVDEELEEPEKEEDEELIVELDLDDPELEKLIRKLANEEIDKRPIPEKVIIREVEKVVETKPEPKPEPKVEPKPVVKAKPEPKPKAKVERISFPDRMQMIDDSVKENYNLLKNYLLSYGLNSRISNVGDSFRLGRVLYARITNSGNSGLKIYLPLDVEDYKDSTIPLKSAAGVKQYEDVPAFLYVRSDLSVKRALELIDDVMLKHGIARKHDTQDIDYVKELVK